MVHCFIEEFVEGTMINCFYIPEVGWEMATKSNIGANCKFASKKTFREMFLETWEGDFINNTILNKEYVYSFVLQHPENRIVSIVSTPKIVLVELYQIINNEIIKFNIHNMKLPFPKPKIYKKKKNDTWKTVYTKFHNYDWNIMGCIIKNANLDRSKIRNQTYETIHKLKGNHNKLQYIYYNLRKMKKVQHYLKYYPEHKEQFDKFATEIYQWTHHLFENYKNCFIYKENKLPNYPFQYRIHMYNLHQIYHKQLRANNLYINKQIVINYVNNLDCAALMYLINFKNRK